MATGFLHPGAMGSSVAAACSGERFWASEGRSTATSRRADDAGLTDVGTLDELAARCDSIVSICPPDQADAVAASVAAAGFDGVYVDANAVAPATACRTGARFARFVDGGIIGPPARRAGTTRLYLSGERPDDVASVAALWTGSVLGVRPIEGGPGAASALKMVYAGWTKGTSALLLAICAAADAHGVADVLRDEWSVSLPELPDRASSTAQRTSPKAWRFDGEMHEIAATFEAVGLPPGFHLAAAEVYRRLAEFRDADPMPDLDAVVAALDATPPR